MLTELQTRYPNHNWGAMEILPIIYMSGSGTYRVNMALWPTSTYPTPPTPAQIATW